MFNLKERLCRLLAIRNIDQWQGGEGDIPENNFDLDNIPPCPNCASTDVAVFIYGKPPLKSVILDGLESGKIISGGCMIRRTAPKWHCYSCNNDFGRLR
jgi:hypothetical protein